MAVLAFAFLTATSFGALLFHYHSRGSTLREEFLWLVDWRGTPAFLIVSIPYGLTFALLYYYATKFILSRSPGWYFQIEILIAASISLLGFLTLVLALPIACK